MSPVEEPAVGVAVSDATIAGVAMVKVGVGDAVGRGEDVGCRMGAAVGCGEGAGVGVKNRVIVGGGIGVGVGSGV